MNSSPLTRARAAHEAARATADAAQAMAAETAAEVQRLEAMTPGQKLAEATFSASGATPKTILVHGGPSPLWFDVAESDNRDGVVMQLVKTTAALIDTAVAEALAERDAAAPQPAELPEGETPEAVAELLRVAEMALSPERDSFDGYDVWHSRLKVAAKAAIATVKP